MSLASCSSTGFAGTLYTSPDEDGKRAETVFFSDYAESPGIYFVVPIVSGRNDETLTVSVKVFDVLGTNVEKTFPNPIIVSQQAPGVETKPTNVVVQFPDPPPVTVPDPSDPLESVQIQYPRAVGHYEFIASMNGDTEAVKFQINNPTPQYQGLPPTPNEPQPGECNAAPALQGGNLQLCPQPTADDQANHKIACCTTAGVCGTGVEDTGLCN